jgi:hypothetical protein
MKTVCPARPASAPASSPAEVQHVVFHDPGRHDQHRLGMHLRRGRRILDQFHQLVAEHDRPGVTATSRPGRNASVPSGGLPDSARPDRPARFRPAQQVHAAILPGALRDHRVEEGQVRRREPRRSSWRIMKATWRAWRWDSPGTPRVASIHQASDRAASTPPGACGTPSRRIARSRWRQRAEDHRLVQVAEMADAEHLAAEPPEPGRRARRSRSSASCAAPSASKPSGIRIAVTLSDIPRPALGRRAAGRHCRTSGARSAHGLGQAGGGRRRSSSPSSSIRRSDSCRP